MRVLGLPTGRCAVSASGTDDGATGRASAIVEGALIFDGPDNLVVLTTTESAGVRAITQRLGPDATVVVTILCDAGLRCLPMELHRASHGWRVNPAPPVDRVDGLGIGRHRRPCAGLRSVAR